MLGQECVHAYMNGSSSLIQCCRYKDDTRWEVPHSYTSFVSSAWAMVRISNTFVFHIFNFEKGKSERFEEKRTTKKCLAGGNENVSLARCMKDCKIEGACIFVKQKKMHENWIFLLPRGGEKAKVNKGIIIIVIIWAHNASCSFFSVWLFERVSSVA